MRNEKKIPGLDETLIENSKDNLFIKNPISIPEIDKTLIEKSKTSFFITD